jgi:hypothetical protein
LIVDDFGVPLQRPARRRPHHPPAAPAAQRRDRVEVLHEPRQIAEVAPELVKLLARAIDGNPFEDVEHPKFPLVSVVREGVSGWSMAPR